MNEQGAIERAAVYARVSRDRGDTTSVEEQVEECVRDSARRGWDLADHYLDRNKSASRPGTRRPEYERLLDDVRAGRVQRLLVYMTDRLYRQPRELEDLIDLAEQRPLEIATVRSGDLDLSTPEGRAFARTAAAWNKLEVEKLSERSSRGKAFLKANGGWLGGGARPFGYERVKDERGKVKEHRVREDEAAVLRELVRRALNDATLGRLARELNERGVTTSGGKRWNPSRIRATLTSPFHAGQHGDGTTGNWPAIITADERRLLLARFPRSEGTGQHPPRAYALSGMVRCSECEKKMLGSGGRYVCSPRNGGCGKVRVTSRHVDELVRGQVMARAEEPEPAQPTPGPDQDRLLAELRRVEVQLLELRESLADDLTIEDFKPARDVLLRRKDGLERQIREQAPQPRIRFAELAEEPEPLDWNEFIGEYVEGIEITRALRVGRGALADIPGRVRITWRGVSGVEAGGLAGAGTATPVGQRERHQEKLT